jgi:hypothetical protein
MLSNREVYGSVEFESWAKRADIEPAEAYLFRNYLDPLGRMLKRESVVADSFSPWRAWIYAVVWFDFVPEFVLS